MQTFSNQTLNIPTETPYNCTSTSSHRDILVVSVSVSVSECVSVCVSVYVYVYVYLYLYVYVCAPFNHASGEEFCRDSLFMVSIGSW